MTEEGIGVLLLRRAGGAVGLVSERDIVAALANGADPDVVWAEDVMSEDLVAVAADDRIVDAATELVDRGIRHAPVVDGDDVIGVVSLRDLASVLIDSVLSA
jgi:CBS domain-containing protein